jgi:moderate conductance mechanosensitive channel
VQITDLTFAEIWDYIFSQALLPVGRIFLILIIAVLTSRVLRKILRRSIFRLTAYTDSTRERSEQRGRALTALSNSFVVVLVWSTALLTILGTLGINLAPLIAGAGIAGVALGFGAQSLVKDFLSGVLMLVEDQYGVGDVVDIGGTIGEVESVSLRTTRLRSVDGTVWHIPNGEVIKLGNLSQDWSRIILDVSVAYKSDIAKAKAELAQVLNDFANDPHHQRYILEAPEVLGVQGLSDNSVDIRLAIKVKAGTQWELTRNLRELVKTRLDQANIEIPFPQLSIWMQQP